MLFHDNLGTKDLKDKDDKSKVAFLSHHVKTMSVLNPIMSRPCLSLIPQLNTFCSLSLVFRRKSL